MRAPVTGPPLHSAPPSGRHRHPSLSVHRAARRDRCPVRPAPPGVSRSASQEQGVLSPCQDCILRWHRFSDQRPVLLLCPTARVLVHEWAKYRWGVFEESGYAGDPLYPSFYRRTADQWAPTGCSDAAVAGTVSP